MSPTPPGWTIRFTINHPTCGLRQKKSIPKRAPACYDQHQPIRWVNPMNPFVRPNMVKAGIMLACLAVTLVPDGLALDVVVDAQCNIYGAGHTAPYDTPSVGTHGGGVPPAVIPLDQLGNPPALTMSASGSVLYCPTCGYNGPDGTTSSSAAPAYNGISGVTNCPGRSLRAVFTSDSEPANPAPPSLDFASIGADYPSLKPGLAQMFFIGDGRAGPAGPLQVIHVPVGATKLYLGFVDGNGYNDIPDWYSDDTGSLNVSVSSALVLGVHFSGSGPDLSVYGAPGSTNRIEYTPVLPATNWTRLTNVVLETVPTIIHDATFSGDSSRFYRAVSLP